MPQTSSNFDHYLNLTPDHRADALEWIDKLAGEELGDLCNWLCWSMEDDHGIKLDPAQTAADLRIYIEGHLQQMYDESESLGALRDVLNHYQAYADAYANPVDLESLIDITSLPTFGGSEPTDTLGVFSWDDARVLIYDNAWPIRCRPAELIEHDDKRARLAGWFGGASWGWSGDDESEFKAAIWDEMEAQGVRAAPWFESKASTLDAIDITPAG